MADAIMSWDAKQSRWRKTYKKRALQVRASELGGTNYADTVVAANQWFRDQKAQIDRELAVDTFRPNEAEYRAELESLESDIRPLTALIRNPAYANLFPVLEVLRQKVTLLKKALQKPTLPPLDDRLRNPRHISPERLDEEALQDAKQLLLKQRYPVLTPDELREVKVVDGKEYIVRKVISDNDEFKEVMLDVESVIDHRLTQAAQAKDRTLAWKKREVGAVISDREQGKLDQLLEEQGATIPVSRQLDHHIDKFIKYQQRRCKEGKITAGRLGKITSTIESYRRWSSLVSVSKVGTKDHIDAYYTFLSDKVINKEIKPEYANNLFGTFKMMVYWFVDEGVLSTCPPCLQRKGDKYTFVVERSKPKTVALDWVKKILDAAEPRLRLCILLTLNCGFGASEIGQLTKDEYDPATGRITHKRCKTQKSVNAPTVCYKLWDVTKAALDAEIANRKKYPQHRASAAYLLVNGNGKPLWSQHVDKEGKAQKNDNISNDFKRLVAKLREAHPDMPAITYYQFRRTSATLIYNEPRFRMYNELWLAHSPRSVADKHYNDVGDTILDDCITWLHDKIFGVAAPQSEAESC